MELMARYLMANKSPSVVAHTEELTTYETLKQCDGCIISTNVLGGYSALVKSTIDAPHVLSGFVMYIGTNNIYVHIVMVPTYT